MASVSVSCTVKVAIDLLTAHELLCHLHPCIISAPVQKASGEDGSNAGAPPSVSCGQKINTWEPTTQKNSSGNDTMLQVTFKHPFQPLTLAWGSDASEASESFGSVPERLSLHHLR